MYANTNNTHQLTKNINIPNDIRSGWAISLNVIFRTIIIRTNFNNYDKTRNVIYLWLWSALVK